MEAKNVKEALRSPEYVEKDWNEETDGAWAPGKAPLQLLTTFLECVQEQDVVEAELTGRKILQIEPHNKLVQDLLDAMKQQEAMEAEMESDDEESESEEESEQEEESDEKEISDEEDESEKYEESPHQCDEK